MTVQEKMDQDGHTSVLCGVMVMEHGRVGSVHLLPSDSRRAFAFFLFVAS